MKLTVEQIYLSKNIGELTEEAANELLTKNHGSMPCIECSLFDGATEPVEGCEQCPPVPSSAWVPLAVHKTK